MQRMSMNEKEKGQKKNNNPGYVSLTTMTPSTGEETTGLSQSHSPAGTTLSRPPVLPE